MEKSLWSINLSSKISSSGRRENSHRQERVEVKGIEELTCENAGTQP